MQARKDKDAEKSPLKLLIWTAVAGLIFGLIGFGEIAEDWLRVGRNTLHTHNASGDIVLVKIDDQSLREIGRWPWPRHYHGQLASNVTDAGAKRVFFDIVYESVSDGENDQLLADALKRSGRVVLPVRARWGPSSGGAPDTLPPPILRQHAQLGSISVIYNYQNAVWWLPYSTNVKGKEIPSFAAMLSGVYGPPNTSFPIDYSVDVESIPTVSAAAVLNGRVPNDVFAGKDVIIGVTSEVPGDQYFLPGHGKDGGTYVQILGAETLKAGTPVFLGWIPAFLLALAVAVLVSRPDRRVPANIVLGLSAALLLLLPVFLEANLIFVDVVPAVFVLGIMAAVLNWRRWRRNGLVNAVSGLPNLSALRSNRSGRDQALIAAKVLNYAEIVATLPANAERHLIEQIVARLTVGAPDRALYQGDGGIFAWFEESRQPFGNHIDALHALFRNPARVGHQTIDLSISFGVELGSSRSIANRLGSALVAADEAAHDGLKWKYHDPDTLQDASWKLSMLSQLDSAVDKGEIWVAYQPKLDLKTGRIVGAEALARWTHPEKGPIAASEFIAAAEQHDRIGKLTDFVLEQAIGAAARLGTKQRDFGVAVNLSARLLADKGFTLRLAALLARHRLSPARLTLELTETATLAGSGSGIEMLASIRDLGVSISIDDYGTGLSTLDYLKKIPAREIKIDQSFVKGMVDNRSDLVMVQSTIALAHSLGRQVVAEGVESREVLDALTQMGCDVGQGFIIGRPMSIESLAKRLSATARKIQAA